MEAATFKTAPKDLPKEQEMTSLQKSRRVIPKNGMTLRYPLPTLLSTTISINNCHSFC